MPASAIQVDFSRCGVKRQVLGMFFAGLSLPSVASLFVGLTSCTQSLEFLRGHDGAKHLNDFYQLNFDTSEWCRLPLSHPTFATINKEKILLIPCQGVPGDNQVATGQNPVTDYTVTFVSKSVAQCRSAGACV